MIHGTANGPNIYLVVVSLRLYQFWSQVKWRAHSAALNHLVGFLSFRNSEVAQLYLFLVIYENIEAFDISVHDSVAVKEVDGF